MIERFLYHAFATAAAGRITAPFQEIIPIQASSALSGNGGFGSSRVDDFQFHDILSFASAHSVVAGSYSQEKGSHSSIATVTVEGLDILGVVRADRIMCRVASSHPDDPEKPHSITFIGSHFDNLRIAGYPVKLDLAMDRFAKYDTAAALRDAYRKNDGEDLKSEPKKAGFRDEFNRMCLVGYGEPIPPRVQKYLPWTGWNSPEKLPEHNGMVSGTLVRSIEGLGPELEQYGHIIVVKGFGIIRLAEFHITETARKLVMLQLSLGCTPEGDLTLCGAEGNGTGW
jgi:hypothetical protein